MNEPLRIVVEDITEPLAEASDLETLDRLANSAASEALESALGRYCGGQIRGRSYLVSGHRGAGKTTLVLRSIQRTILRLRGQARYPLLVKIQGPTLFQDPNGRTAAGGNGANGRNGGNGGNGANGDAADPDAVDETQSPPDEDGGDAVSPPEEPSAHEAALRQITLALYRALATEIGVCFRHHLARTSPRGRSFSAAAELGVGLQLALDDLPDPADLRDFWRRAGALESGVVYSWSEEGNERGTDRGGREILALAAASQAFRVVSGTFEQTRSREAQASAQQTVESTTSSPTQALVEKLASTLPAAAVGAGLAMQSARPAGVVLGTVATLAATVFTLKLTSTRSRQREVQESYTFIRRRDSSTLERELPVLVERLFRIGLAPVFVIDELDKVPDIQGRMRTMVQHLKLFLSDSAFFCFLTDRDYFEHLRHKALNEAYPPEHTYFSDRLFVSFRPGELRRYLRSVLQTDGVQDREELPLLGYVLLHRARMHSVDLRRQLARIRRPGTSGIRINRGDLRSPNTIYPFEIMVQLAVEQVMATGDVAQRLDQDPNFGQPIYDALYYASRRWAEGHGELDLSDAALDRYLEERMDPNKERRGEPPIEAGANGRHRPATGDEAEPESQTPAAEADPIPGIPLTLADLDLLREAARSVVDYLVEPERLVADLEERKSAEEGLEKSQTPDFVAAIDVIPKETPLLVDEGNDTYRWTRDIFGRVQKRPGTELAAEDWQKDRSFIDEMQTFVRSACGLGLQELADDLYVLSRSPRWEDVEAAMSLLQDGQPHDDGPAADARHTLQIYRSRLEERGAALGAALIYSALVGQVVAGDRREKTAAGLRSLAATGHFESLSTAVELERMLREIGETAPEGLSTPDLGLSRDAAADWRHRVSTAIAQITGDDTGGSPQETA